MRRGVGGGVVELTFYRAFSIDWRLNVYSVCRDVSRYTPVDDKMIEVPGREGIQTPTDDERQRRQTQPKPNLLHYSWTRRLEHNLTLWWRTGWPHHN